MPTKARQVALKRPNYTVKCALSLESTRAEWKWEWGGGREGGDVGKNAQRRELGERERERALTS